MCISFISARLLCWSATVCTLYQRDIVVLRLAKFFVHCLCFVLRMLGGRRLLARIFWPPSLTGSSFTHCFHQQQIFFSYLLWSTAVKTFHYSEHFWNLSSILAYMSSILPADELMMVVESTVWRTPKFPDRCMCIGVMYTSNMISIGTNADLVKQVAYWPDPLSDLLTSHCCYKMRWSHMI